MMDQASDQKNDRHCSIGLTIIAEDAGSFAKVEVGRGEDLGALVEPADQVEE